MFLSQTVCLFGAEATVNMATSISQVFWVKYGANGSLQPATAVKSERESEWEKENGALCHEQPLPNGSLQSVSKQQGDFIESRNLSKHRDTKTSSTPFIQKMLFCIESGLGLMKLVSYESRSCFLLISCLSFSLTCCFRRVFEWMIDTVLKVLTQRALISVSPWGNAFCHFSFCESKKRSRFGWLAWSS